MKKIYNQPTCIVVALGTCQMMAESFTINQTTDPEKTISSQDQILTKETSDIDLWDNEW